jgi:ABC-type phosphate/phosphonate transport system substrate-binding protein
VPAAFFGAIGKSESQIAALDQVARGEAQATVIDTPWLDYYKDVKGSVFEKNLRILQQSEVVPPAVLVYRKGALAQATLDQVADGLRKTHRDLRGRTLMQLWHIDAFEPVPGDYHDNLHGLLKEYPPPGL